MNKSVAVIGGGPAGLMAAEVISARGVKVDVYDSMPSLGRKFLMAGKSGLNLTHSEPFEQFAARYGDRRKQIEPMISARTAEAAMPNHMPYQGAISLVVSRIRVV